MNLRGGAADQLRAMRVWFQGLRYVAEDGDDCWENDDDDNAGVNE